MDINEIYSVTALREMARYHEMQAAEIRRREARLTRARNAPEPATHDAAQLIKAGKYLLNQPGFLDMGATEWRKIAGKFLLDSGAFERHARRLTERERRQIIDAKRRAVLKMTARGMEGKAVAKAVGLSPARVSQIKNDDPDRAKAKAAGLALTTYKRLKAAGKLRPGL